MYATLHQDDSADVEKKEGERHIMRSVMMLTPKRPVMMLTPKRSVMIDHSDK